MKSITINTLDALLTYSFTSWNSDEKEATGRRTEMKLIFVIIIVVTTCSAGENILNCKKYNINI